MKNLKYMLDQTHEYDSKKNKSKKYKSMDKTKKKKKSNDENF